MTFSIVIPTFNGGNYIESTLLSSINQTREADEIIVYDDNSQDKTAEICKTYISRIKYILNENGPSGFVGSWNRAIKCACSDYIAILHQDDIIYPTFLEEVEIALIKHPDSKHLFSLCDYISDTGRILVRGEESIKESHKLGDVIIFSGQDYIKEYQKEYPNIAHIHRCPGVVTHRSVFDMGCYYQPEAGHIADDDFFYRVGLHTSVIGIIKSLAAFRIHDESETGRIGDINLVSRLSKDYLYQVKQWKNSDFIKGDSYYYFVNNALKFTNRLFGYGLKGLNYNLIKLSYNHMTSLNLEGYKNPNKMLQLLFYFARNILKI